MYHFLYYLYHLSLLGKYLIDVDTNIKKVDKAIIFSGTGSINYENVEFYNRFEDAKGLFEKKIVNKLVIMQRKHNRINEGMLLKNFLSLSLEINFTITVVDKEFPTTYQNVLIYEKIHK